MENKDFDWKRDYYDKLSPIDKEKLHQNQRLSFVILGTLILVSIIALILSN